MTIDFDYNTVYKVYTLFNIYIQEDVNYLLLFFLEELKGLISCGQCQLAQHQNPAQH